MKRNHRKKFVLTTIICLLWGLLAVDTLWLLLLLICGMTFFNMRKNKLPQKINLQSVDLCLVMIGIVEAVLYFCSTYSTNSIYFPLIFLTFIFLWFFLRLWIIEPDQKHLILGILTVTGGILAIFTIFFFAFYWVKVRDMGFGDITQFRNLYRPMWMLSNDWVSIMLAFMPFAIASFFALPKPYCRMAAVACLLISQSVIVSFSRGAIFGLILLYGLTIFLLLYYRIYPVKRVVLGCCLWFAMLAVVCIPVRSPLFTTLAITETTSQVRSIEGRFNKWKDAVELFSQYPITGVGAGNFALKVESISNQREFTYTGRATNSWLQLAAEKGVVGLLAYGFLLIVWAIGAFKTLRLRHKHHLSAMICGAGVMVCLLREATFSTFFMNPALLLLILLLFWVNVNNGTGKRNIQIHWAWTFLFMIPIICFGVLQTRQKEAVISNRSFVRIYEKGENGWEKLQKSLHLSPNNAVLHANKGFYLLSQLSGYDSMVFLNATIHDSTLFLAKNAFEQAVTLSPSDASFRSSLGILELVTGDTVSAIQHFSQSLRLSPHQSIYHIIYGMVSPNESYERFVHAVYYSPDILDSKWFSNMQAQDSILAASIVNDVQVMLSDHRNDTLLKARLAKLLLYQGNTEAAENLLHEVTRDMPNLNRPWLMLGDIASVRKDTVALQYYKRSVQLDPSDVWAKMRTGDWYYNKGDTEKAFGYYIDALRTVCLAPTEHSRRCYSIYGKTYTIANDVVPPVFYWYIRPYIDVQKLADIIAQGYEQKGNTSKSVLYRQFVNGEIRIRTLINFN